MADVTLDTYALTTLEAVKRFIKDTPDADDNALKMLINSASAEIENYCNRKFLSRDYEDEVHYLDNYTRRLLVDNFPITAITSITDDDTALTDDELEDCENRISWIRLDTERKGEILVSYTAGYETVPSDVELACILLVQVNYNTEVASYSVTFTEAGNVFRPQRLPSRVAQMLSAYRKLPV